MTQPLITQPPLPAFLATLVTETNTFAPIPTGLASFEETHWTRRDASLTDPQGMGSTARLFRELAEADGRAVIESIAAFAQPAGPTVAPVYAMLRGHILEDLRAAGPVGMVLLGLHGAMIAEGCDDCEGDIIAAVREIVGPDVPIGVELDPHCHLTQRMVSAADAVVIMKEYPHTDWDDRARELYAICSAAAAGDARPVSAMFDCRMVGFYPTTMEPMAGVVRALKAAEREAGVLSVSLAHGFPWGDHPDMGTRVLVITDGDEALAARTAERLGHTIYALRDTLLPKLASIPDAIAKAGRLEGLVVMADTADNTGGGAPGDTTHLLQGLLEADIGPAVFGAIYDPGAVRVCMEAGEGARVWLRVGGKLGMTSGDPLDVEVEVVKVVQDHQQSFSGSVSSFGPSAWVRIGRIDVVLVSVRSQVYGRDAFTGLGITLEDKRIVAVKSSEHYRADFGPIADHVIPVATPGAIQMDFVGLPYRNKRDLDFHPRVADPLGLDAA
ncbi:M81 family metallopeptidase [Novosphingobium sp. 1949]|uniref:Microcystinase C n=1 Tax=Novosphingobium organovorum TaxID=2930092 RepID=A0ABT0BGB2_9SPHN|nr:M81 family metallopeptidase [Novosphingobium organovorum]MCJ2184102.1 M81 family metallopeptidase [Novosphingobium organovorum]